MTVARLSEIVLAAILGLGGVAGAFKALGLGTMRRKINDFFDDWNGRPPRDGDEGRASFPARLAAVEKEFKTNGGGSLRDVVNRAAKRAEEAADLTVETAAALGRADHEGRRERAAMDAKLDGLAENLGRFARDTRERERRYIERLSELGLDLAGLTEDLNERELGDEQR